VRIRFLLSVSLFTLSLQAAAYVPLEEPPEMPSDATIQRYRPLIERASRLHDVDDALVHALIYAESSYDPRARSPQGAQGLMQLMPETARRYGVRDSFDPAQNILGGVRFLKDLLVLFGGNIELVIAAYNSGADAVIRAGMRVPPHPETLAFVPRVVRYYESFRVRRD
jgi:soluble lytic murein transglycosylase-like protein